ncbi:MAG: hypothetical protein D6805_03345 [Planctomycetota bacterium]|nr:MAG: hypothetical protein D6805_03345 [Planctomycetota bacterium]
MKRWFWYSVVLLFFFSGLIGLVHQIFWFRRLHLILGSTAVAVAASGASYMLGLALGGIYFGRCSLVRPLRVYGLLELGVGLYGLILPVLLAGVGYIRLVLWGDWGGGMGSLMVFLVSLVVLFLPAFWMGGTLPVLAELARGRKFGEEVVWLYTVNTFGASLGVLLGGFYFLPVFGLLSSMLLAALGNILVGVVAIWMSGRVEVAEVREEDVEGFEFPKRFLLLYVVGLTGCALFILEVVWSRLLALLLGSSIYATSLMLGVVILGLGLGSLLVSLVRGRVLLWVLMGGVGLAVFFSFLSLWWYGELPGLFLKWYSSFEGERGLLLPVKLLVVGLVILPVVLFLGMCFPSVLRLYLRDVRRDTGRVYAWNMVGALFGAVLGAFWLLPGWGIWWSIVVANVCLLVALGMVVWLFSWRRWLRVGWIFFLLCGWWVMYILAPSWERKMMVAGPSYYTDLGRFRSRLEKVRLLFYQEGLHATVSVERDLVAHSVWIKNDGKIEGGAPTGTGRSNADMPTQILLARLPLMLVPRSAKRVLAIGLGSGITVSEALRGEEVEVECVEIEPAVWRALREVRAFDVYNGYLFLEGLERYRRFFLALEGEEDLVDLRRCLEDYGRVSPLRLEGRLERELERSGEGLLRLASRFGLEGSIRRCIEREPEALFWLYRDLRSSERLEEIRRRRRRFSLRIDDARSYLYGRGRRYDVIISQPSEPWLAGSASLFTEEFFRLVRGRLRRGGKFCQWLQLYHLPLEVFLSVVRAFQRVFPYVYIFHHFQTNEVLLVGSLEYFGLDVGVWEEEFDRFRSSFEEVGIRDVLGLYLLFLMGPEEVRGFVGEGVVNTDDNAFVETRAPFFRHSRRLGEGILEAILGEGSDLGKYLKVGRRVELWGRLASFFTLFSLLQRQRGRGLVRFSQALLLAERAWRETKEVRYRKLMGDIYFHWGRVEEAFRLWEEVLGRHPRDYSTRFTKSCAYLVLGRYEEAERSLRRLARFYPFSREVRWLLGILVGAGSDSRREGLRGTARQLLLGELSKYFKPVSRSSEVRVRRSLSKDLLAKKVEGLLERGEVYLAERELLRLRGHRLYLYLRGLLHRRKGELVEARRCLEEFLGRDLYFVRGYLELAEVCEELGDLEAAERYYLKYLELRGDGFRSGVEGGRFARFVGDYEGRIVDLRRRIVELERRGRYPLGLYEELVELQWELVERWEELSEVRGLGFILRALRVEGGEVLSMLRRRYGYFVALYAQALEGRYSSRAGVLRFGLRSIYDRAFARLGEGEVSYRLRWKYIRQLEGLGLFVEARRQLEYLCRVRPRDWVVWYHLAELEQVEGNFVRSIEIYRKVVKIHFYPEAGRRLRLLEYLRQLEESGLGREGMRYLEEEARRRPEDWWLAYLLAQKRWRVSPKEAIGWFRKVYLSSAPKLFEVSAKRYLQKKGYFLKRSSTGVPGGTSGEGGR